MSSYNKFIVADEDGERLSIDFPIIVSKSALNRRVGKKFYPYRDTRSIAVGKLGQKQFRG